MAAGDNITGFPDISNKLAAPQQLSNYQREKQAQEAKRQRAETENAEALRQFEEEFAATGDDADDWSASRHHRSSHGPPRGFSSRYAGPAGRFNGPPSDARSGPGSLGPLSGPPPPSLKRKRVLEHMRESEEAARREDGWFVGDRTTNTTAVNASSGPPERSMPKPTIRLSSLPPFMTAKEVGELLKPYVKVHSVKFDNLTSPRPNSRKACAANATLHFETAPAAIDAAVSALRQKYLGCGYFLSIARHTSSAVLLPSRQAGPLGAPDEPFGAQKPRDEPSRGRLRNAPPPSEFGPPPSYGAQVSVIPSANATVDVSTTMDPGSLRAIHANTSLVRSQDITRRAQLIESLLMNQGQVPNEQRFAYLYDSRSQEGAYFRYLLWRHEAEEKSRGRVAKNCSRPLGDTRIDWSLPHPKLQYSSLSSLGQTVEHSDYSSSEEESADENEEKRVAREKENTFGDRGVQYMSPLQQAQFAWLLSNLPTNHRLVQQADIVAITAFAAKHVTAGAGEIVDVLLLNVEQPFSLALGAERDEDSLSGKEDESTDEIDERPSLGAPPQAEESMPNATRKTNDPSSAKLVALYVINDILLNTATNGAQGVWKYRQLFEAGLLASKTFEHLGQLGKQLDWRRLRTDQWQKQIVSILDVWGSKSMFKEEVHAKLKSSFMGQAAEEDAKKDNVSAVGLEGPFKGPRKARFIPVDGHAPSLNDTSPSASPSQVPETQASNNNSAQLGRPDVVPLGNLGSVSMEGIDGIPMKDIDGTPMEDIDGTPMKDIDGTPMKDIDGTPMEDIDGVPMEDLDGVPMSDTGQAHAAFSGHPAGGDHANNNNSDASSAPVPHAGDAGKKAFSMSIKPAKGLSNSASGIKPTAAEPRRRMKVEDMFADSDEE